MAEFDRKEAEHLLPNIQRLGVFLDTINPAVSEGTEHLLFYAEKSGTVSRLTGVEYEDPVTNQRVLDLTIRRKNLEGEEFPHQVEARSAFMDAIKQISKGIAPLIRIETRQINDEDVDGNIERGCVALNAPAYPKQKARVEFEQRFKTQVPGVYSNSERD